mgnify:CR=1 FL=1
MRMGRGQAGAALVLCLALAGCASGESLDGVFGAQDTGVATGNTGGVNNTPGRLAVGSGPNAVAYECPQLTVRTGAAAARTLAEPVRYLKSEPTAMVA